MTKLVSIEAINLIDGELMLKFLIQDKEPFTKK